MLSAIIRGRTTSCCFLAYRRLPRGACAMPRATGWAPALLASRGGVTARPTPSGSIPDSAPPRRSGDRGCRETPLLSSVPTQAPPVSLRRSKDCRLFCHSNFLTTRQFQLQLHFTVNRTCPPPACALHCYAMHCMRRTESPNQVRALACSQSLDLTSGGRESFLY
jgi:hypothetical protein